MGRPLKRDGIDYFSLDSDFFGNEKIRRIKAQCGMKGIGFLIWLFCDIYAGEGYYKKFTYDDCALLADEAGGGVGAETVREVVKSSLKCGLFERQVFEKYGVLTSSRIQENYLRACERRSAIFIDRRYWVLSEKDVKPSTLVKVTLLDVIDDKKGINVDNNSENVSNNAINRKVKENIYILKARKSFGQYGHVSLTDEEYGQLCAEYPDAETRIQIMDLHMEQHPEYSSNNPYATLTQGWVNRAIEKDKQKRRSSSGKSQKNKPGAQFHDFDQRTYDYDQLLREINGW